MQLDQSSTSTDRNIAKRQLSSEEPSPASSPRYKRRCPLESETAVNMANLTKLSAIEACGLPKNQTSLGDEGGDTAIDPDIGVDVVVDTCDLSVDESEDDPARLGDEGGSEISDFSLQSLSAILGLAPGSLNENALKTPKRGPIDDCFDMPSPRPWEVDDN